MTRVRALLAGALLIGVVAVLAACSGGGAAASVSPPPGVDASIDAKDIKFSASTLNVPAGKPFHLFFRNLEGAPHNVAIYRDSSAGQPIFVGETITNTATTYNVPVIPAGTYFFRCDVHPQMNGSVVAGG
jgi:plastocyanin